MQLLTRIFAAGATLLVGIVCLETSAARAAECESGNFECLMQQLPEATRSAYRQDLLEQEAAGSLTPYSRPIALARSIRRIPDEMLNKTRQDANPAHAVTVLKEHRANMLVYVGYIEGLRKSYSSFMAETSGADLAKRYEDRGNTADHPQPSPFDRNTRYYREVYDHMWKEALEEMKKSCAADAVAQTCKTTTEEFKRIEHFLPDREEMTIFVFRRIFAEGLQVAKILGR